MKNSAFDVHRPSVRRRTAVVPRRKVVVPVPGRALRAVTLIEVLVASVLLGLGVAGLISVASLAMRNQQRVEHRATALYFAQEKLADVELVGPHTWMAGYPVQGREARAGVVYEWTTRIEDLAVGELFSVNVGVHWSGPSGSGDVELETWLNDYEADDRVSFEDDSALSPRGPSR